MEFLIGQPLLSGFMEKTLNINRFLFFNTLERTHNWPFFEVNCFRTAFTHPRPLLINPSN